MEKLDLLNDQRKSPPWWTIYLSPSIIPMLPYLAIIFLGPLVALLLPLVGFLRACFR
jgi:hypothetical protein